MLETKLWHNKIDTKNVKVAKMMEFIKTCDQYPHRFNFDNFFNSITVDVSRSAGRRVSLFSWWRLGSGL